jgi:predicted nuclease of predicted toxin-antitoxin system
MRFKLDENLPLRLATELKNLGHDVDTVPEEGLAGAPDDEVVSAASAEGRILLTLDKDLASLLQYPTCTHAGVVLFRPDALGRKNINSFVLSRMASLLKLELSQRLTVVSFDRIRVR